MTFIILCSGVKTVELSNLLNINIPVYVAEMYMNNPSHFFRVKLKQRVNAS